MAATIIQLEQPISDRELSKREEIIIWKSSKLCGCVFPPWRAAPTPDVFNLKYEALFIDPSYFQLSDAQKKVFKGWCRPDEALPPCSTRIDNHHILEKGSTMISHERIDLVQDLTNDCSVVASLCSMLAREDRGHVRLLPSIMYPFDTTQGRPARSLNGKYVFRLNFNGCYRTVVIDDRLPASTSARTLHIIDRRNPRLLWPALIEKAYLKIRGGYDFPGSNSGTDLWVITGWIPEQIFLHSRECLADKYHDSDDVDPNSLWRRVFNAHSYGDVLITVGTGKLTTREEEGTGLVAEHDYAIIDMKETKSNVRSFLVKNSWSEENAWKHHRDSSCSSAQGRDVFDITILSKDLTPGTFWMSMDNIFQNFESIYLNWNPGLFSYRQDFHFQWDLTKQRSTLGSLEANPQYVVHSDHEGTAWILLSRHFQDTLLNSTEGSVAGFISLYAFNRDGHRVFLSDGALAQSPYVDAPNTLLKLQLSARSSYTVVVSEQDLLLSNHTFSLSIFSLKPLMFKEAVNKNTCLLTYQGSWASSSCGGNANSPAYYTNPQLSLTLSAQSNLSILLAAEEDFSVHIKLVWAGGKRVNSITNRDIICDSGDYRRGSAVTEISDLQAGIYTLICSTFEQGQCGKFSLRVYSSANCLLRPIPSDEAGRLVTKVPQAVFNLGLERLLAPIQVNRITRLRAVVKGSATPATTHSSPLRIALEYGQGPYKETLAVSGNAEFKENLMEVRIEDVDIASAMCQNKGVWLVLERLGGPCLQAVEAIEIVILSDSPVGIGPWGKEMEDP